MATKNQTTKRKSSPKKSSTASKNANSIKPTTRQSPASTANPAFMQLVYALFAAAITYGFISWAIDSGSLWVYAASFIGIYLTAAYIKAFVKMQFLNK